MPRGGTGEPATPVANVLLVELDLCVDGVVPWLGAAGEGRDAADGAIAGVAEVRRLRSFGVTFRSAGKHDDGAVARIVEQLERSGLEKVMLDGVWPVEAAIRYFRARLPRIARRLDVAAPDRQALAARGESLVTVRMKRPGARWKHTTGDKVMQLRALQLSDRWAPAVQRATRPLAKSV